jgi:hypothetical protein
MMAVMISSCRSDYLAAAGLLVVKICERKAELLGLDSPQKLDIVQVQAQEQPSSFDKIRDAIMRVAE